jgi:HSP20 family molecular chaperone IbpA
MTINNTYTLGRVIPAGGAAVDHLPALFSQRWLTDVLKDWDKAFDVSNAIYPYNIVAETDPEHVPTAYYIEVALAGVGKDNITVNVKDGSLCININKEDQEHDEHVVFYRKGISKRKGQLSFNLNDNTDIHKISSTYADGLLRVKVPVKKPEVVNIDVKVN